MGYNPQLPRLLVYQHLKHLGLHGTRKPLGSIFKCCHLPSTQLAVGREGDGPGWKPGRPLVGEGICLEIAELVSANRAHPAVIFNWQAWRVGGGFSGPHLRQLQATRPGCGNQEQELAREQGRRASV